VSAYLSNSKSHADFMTVGAGTRPPIDLALTEEAAGTFFRTHTHTYPLSTIAL
jgi:hypothetical protein